MPFSGDPGTITWWLGSKRGSRLNPPRDKSPDVPPFCGRVMYSGLRNFRAQFGLLQSLDYHS